MIAQRIIIITLISFLVSAGCSKQPTKQHDSNLNRQYQQYTPANSGLLDYYVQDLAFDDQGRLWIGSGNTYGGMVLSRTDGRLTCLDEGEWIYYDTELLDLNKYFFDRIYIDSKGNKWLHVNGGNLEHESRFLMVDSKGQWHKFEGPESTRHATSFAEDIDHHVYIPTLDGVTLKYVDSTQDVKHYVGISYYESNNEDSIDYADFLKLQGKNYLGLVLFFDSTYLWTTNFEGIKLMEKSNSNTYEFRKLYPFPTGKNYTHLESQFILHNDTLWFNSDKGICYIANDSLHQIYPIPGSYSSKIIDFAFDSNSTLWLMTSYELFKLENKHWTRMDSALPPQDETDFFTCIEIDTHDNKWIGTRQGGLLKYKE